MAASMTLDQDNNRYIYKSDSSTNNYNYAVTFNTANTFVGQNIRVQIHPGTISPYFDNTNLATYFNASTADNNDISITPKATAVNGFINTLTSSNAQTGTAQYYTIKQAVVAADTADVALFSTEGSNAGVNISAIVGAKTTTEPSSGYYLAFKGSGNSKITTRGWVETGSLTSTTSGAKYFPITAAAITASSTNATATTTVAPGTVSISKNTTAVTNKTRLNDDNDIYYKPVTATTNIDTYYIAIKANAAANSTGTTSSISGTTTASVTTAGYAPTSLTGSGSVSGTATAKTSSKDSSVYYIPIPTAVATITGTNTVSPSASLSSSNVTLSDTNNGISVTATGGGTASVTASANITTAGYIPSGDGFKTQVLDAANNTTTATKYISAITIPANKSLTITNNGTATMTTSGTANITSTGTTTVTSNSTSAGTITIAAKTAAGDSSNTSQVVVQNGLWKTTAITAAGTYYGRVTVGSATVTTSSTNDGMTTYFTSGTSSDKNVTITPKYTNTAGYKAAVTTATNNGGISYWKIKTTSLSFSGGGLTGQTASATKGNITWNTDTDNGIYIQTVGTAGRAAVTYTNSAAGWLDAHTSATNASSAITASNWNGEKYYVTAINVPKDIGFTVTTTEDTALDTTSDLNITNAACRQIKITNAGSITTTQSAKSGTIKVNAYDTSSSSSLAGEKTIVEDGTWKTTTITTKPSSATAYYGRVYVNLNTTSVNTNGVTTISGTTATRPTATWGNGWITSGSIAAVTFGNTAASGKTDDSYVDISSTTAAPILTAGGYLYINKGFTDNIKISLAKLVPDSISELSIATAEWIHPNYGAFDANGNEIRGSMTIYQGAYEVD